MYIYYTHTLKCTYKIQVRTSSRGLNLYAPVIHVCIYIYMYVYYTHIENARRITGTDLLEGVETRTAPVIPAHALHSGIGKSRRKKR